MQRLSAGSGVVHSEVADGAEETRFLQAWVRPDEPGLEPSYLTAGVTLGEGWTTVAGGDGAGVVPVAAAGTALQAADLSSGQRPTSPTRPRCTSSSPADR